MNSSTHIAMAIILAGAIGGIERFSSRSWAAQPSHHHNEGHSSPSGKSTGAKKLLPADGASVKILSPKNEQIFQTDRIPLQFALIKGKRGHHVHAYVNGELMGMFNSQTGTLTGIKPGKHVLELRVVAEDHKSELDATNKVEFTVK